MAIASQRFCINRKIAPSLSIEAFFRLVNSWAEQSRAT
jgi:2-keto-myo-inositol isomerase